MSDFNLEKLQKYISDLETQQFDNVPLTKVPKQKNVMKEAISFEAVSSVPIPIDQIVSAEVVKVKKPRKPKTPAQLEAFTKMRAKKTIDDNQKALNKKIEITKALLESEMKKQTAQPKSKKLEPIKEDSESSDEEIVVKKSKKKKKQIVIVDSSDEDSESEKTIERKEVPKDFGKSHRNKKSNIKVYDAPKVNKNFFCD